MQGKLSEIDIRSILQLIELGQRTGELFVEAYSAPISGTSMNGITDAIGSARSRVKPAAAQSWFVFFLNGQIIYAGDSSSTLSRLRDHLWRYKVDKILDQTSASAIAPFNAPEYGYLWALLEERILTPAQGREIIQSMVNETLFDLLSLHQGSFVFELGSALAPQLTTLETAPLVAQIMKQVQEWKQFHPHIQSPDQCPAIADADHLRQTIAKSTFKILEHWADGKTSLRQIARYLHRDLLTVARAVYPHVKEGTVHLLSPAVTESIAQKWGLHLLHQDQVPRVVCIEDSAVVREVIEAILRLHGYEATSIGNPLTALSLVFQLKPDLILCDIAMPELDGYELCAMLRRSTAFRDTPIVMLTGKDGFIDRVRARMVGATDYLTKPFDESELRMLIEKYVGVGQPNRPLPEELLADALQDELEIGS